MKPSQDSQGNPPLEKEDAATAASPKPQVGRPLKYRQLLDILDDDTLYSPGSIARNGEEKGLLPTMPTVAERNYRRLLIRHTLARFVFNHHFPKLGKGGDGLVKLIGQAPAQGWFGATWKAALPQQTKNTTELTETGSQTQETPSQKAGED